VRIAAALTMLFFVCAGVRTTLAAACGTMPCCKKHAPKVDMVRPARPDCCEIKAAVEHELAATLAARTDEVHAEPAAAPVTSTAAAVTRHHSPPPLARPPPDPLYARLL
jgi:hypothetical protein